MSDPADPTAQPNDIVGHKTFWDADKILCRHEPLTRSEADLIIAACYAAKEKRATDMPDEQSAIHAMWSAFQRLRELGWKEAIYCPKDGTPFNCIEPGSTGIHPGFYSGEWPTGYFIVGEGEWCAPSHPILFKLSPENEAKRVAHMAAAAAKIRTERNPLEEGDLEDCR